jgi:hypothetical protein
LSGLQHPAVKLYASGSAVKSDDHFPLFHDYRYLPGAVGIFQHFIQTGGIINDIDIFNVFSVFGIGFTSRRGKGSGVFPINQNFFRHDEFLTENL